MRYLRHLGKPIIEEEKEDEVQEEKPKIDPLEALLKRLGEEENKKLSDNDSYSRSILH